MNLTFNFGATTQYGAQFGVTSITQNGYATGQLSTVAIDPSGVVSAVYTNGRSTQLGQLALANFPNPQGLKQLGDTNWSETFTSGNVVQGTAASAGFGSIQSGALESSNVDSDDGTRQHDHGAAGLPGERAGHHDEQSIVAGRDQHGALAPGPHRSLTRG